MSSRLIFANGIGVGLLVAAFIWIVMPHMNQEHVVASVGSDTQIRALQAQLDQETHQLVKVNAQLETAKKQMITLRKQRMVAKVSARNTQVGSVGQTVQVDISPGMTIDQIAALLVQQGVITNAAPFIQLASNEPFIHAGNYTLNQNENISQVIVTLTTS
ncbi:MAG: hypothetical protein OWR52_00955 [Acidibacillus sp.]|nr:hypothetical protein [Acidibacillus sp.]